MRTFPAAFITEKNKKTDLAPVWILRLTVGGIDYWLSDNLFGITVWNGGIVVRPWIKSWGQLQEGISGGLDEFHVSDFSCSCLIDPDASPNMETLALTTTLEQSPAELYLWFHGLDKATAPPQRMWRGYIKDVSIPDDLTVELHMEDETARLNKFVGTRLNVLTHPLADPDDIGKVIPIVFGAVTGLPALCVDSGWVTSIVSDITAIQTTLTVSELPAYSVLNRSITIDDEQMFIVGVNGKVLTVTRGTNSTIKNVHTKGSTVIEKKATPLVYLVADHAVDSIGTILARVRGVDVDITTSVTKYLGTATNQLAAYPGKAAITVPDFAKVQQRISLAIADSIAINDGLHSHVAGTTTTTTPTSLTQAISAGTKSVSVNLRGTIGTGTWQDFYGDIYWSVAPPPGAILSSSVTIYVTCPSGSSIYIGGILVSENTGALNNAAITFTFNPATQASAMASSGNIIRIRVWLTTIYVASGQMITYDDIRTSSATINSGTRQITYNSTTSANVSLAASPSLVSKTGTVALSGNSVADIMIGDMLLVNVTRNINTPQAVLQNLITNYGGGATVSTIGTMPAGYLINGAITEYKQLLEWCNIIAFQCRSRFRMNNGSAQLMVRPDAITPVKTIAQCVQNSGQRVLSRAKAASSEIINKISILFGRDWTKSGDDAYTQTTTTGTSATSIAIHGELERPELFKFDFVTDPAMAASVQTFYLNWHSVRRWLYTFDNYLDHCELEFNDHITIGFLDNKTAIISQAQLNPGESTRMDKITFVAEG